MPDEALPLPHIGRRTLLLAGGASLAGIALGAAPAAGNSAHAPDGEAESSLFAAEFNGPVSPGEVNVSAIGATAPRKSGGIDVVLGGASQDDAAFARGATVAVMLPPGVGAVDVNDLGAEGPVKGVQLVPLIFGDKPPDR